MVTRILIARHGNTFTKEQIPTRIGRRTDLPLVEEKLGRNLGKYLVQKNLIPDVMWSAPLQRTTQTANLAIAEMGGKIPLIIEEKLSEIDYGVDENKTEEEVEARIGKRAIIDWNEKSITPDGWQVEPQTYIDFWLDFAKFIENEYNDKTIMVVSSNGVIRFAPYITQNFTAFTNKHKLKVATGSISIFEKQNNASWECIAWNISPIKNMKE